MDPSIQPFIAFLLSFILVYISLPAIVRLSKEKKLFDVPNERKVNTTVIPNLGGVALFLGISIGTLLSIEKMDFPDMRYILVGLIIMFYTGIKDDILLISPKKKFLLQVISAGILVVLGNIRFTSLHGFLGIYQIGFFSSSLFSIFVIVAIINSINLVDGIDGLASGLGLLTSLFFGFSFMLYGQLEYALLCFATLGALIPFFLFNVFGKKNKIFMGDTGSLILGLLSSVFIIKYNEYALTDPAYTGSYAPALSFSIVFVPMFDMARVFFLRLKNKKSPFAADKNHLHHKFIDLGYSHLKSTTIIVAYNMFTIGLVMAFKSWDIHLLISLLLVLGILFNFIPDYLLKRRAH
jgi:UDP-N-acetylmuramyl pentapeptide phosphotransferase/UDP-N-acetylglucosamine-1-phosphate transferase